jgi:hypothetical protein
MTNNLFWLRVCEIHQKGKIIDFPIDGITKPLDPDKGYLGIQGFEPSGARKMLKEFEDQGFVKIIGDKYRLTRQGMIYCQEIPETDAGV